MRVEGAKSKWRRRSREEWRAVFKRFAESGVGIEPFCEREDISESSFRRWRGLLADEAPVRLDREIPIERGGFVDAGLVGLGGAGRLEIRLDLGGGVVLHLTRG